MTDTATLEQMLEFRCNRCWHSNCVSCELSGSTVACNSCGVELTVPEATPERIARAAELTASNANKAFAPLPREKSYEEMSAAERRKFEQSQTRVSYAEMDFHSVPLASCLARLAAQFVDGFATAIAMAIGGVLVLIGKNAGLIEIHPREELLANVAVLAVFTFPFLVFLAVQWNLIATRGQTLGKMLLFIRIIDSKGNSPGFLHGVILRNWLRIPLSFIPFFGLLDAAMILTDSRRCIHDYIAGTRVVPSV